MRKLSLFAAILTTFAGTASMLQPNRLRVSSAIYDDASLANNAAFRDGLYLGRLAAERASGAHVASGRWAAEADRASFRAGFQQGYQEFLASRRPASVAASVTD